MLQQSTLSFISELQQNNVKEWFDANRHVYDAARADFTKLVAHLIKIHGEEDKEIAGLLPKDCIFRINRDVRFSKDKSPYKKNFAASFSRGGKKSVYAGYYLHIEPGNNSFIGGGVWAPEAGNLKKIRQEIDYSFQDFISILKHAPFAGVYGDMYKDAEVLLSRPPKGYSIDNPAIDYLKLKSFIALAPVSDKELTDQKLANKITGAMAALQPLLRFLNTAIEG